MQVLAGLAVLKGAPDMGGAVALVDYLTAREAQIVTAREVGFFPVVQAKLSPTSNPGLEMGAVAIQRMESVKDALPALPPIGLGQHDAEFDKVFMDAFQFIVLRGQKPRAVLDREAETLQRLMTEAGAPCWQPDPPSTGPCQVQ
jgi:multiple sugar transport system substrate-binding protein